MTAFGAPQQLYHGHIICTHIPSVLQVTLGLLSLTTRSKTQVIPGHPSSEALSQLSWGLNQLIQTGKRSSGSRKKRSRCRDSAWVPCLPRDPATLCSPLLTPVGSTRLPRTGIKFCWVKNAIFQANFKANPSYSLSAEGAREFQICWWSQRWGCCTWCSQLSVRKVLAL